MLTTDFVAGVRRQASLPSSVSSADILAAGDAEVQSVFVPLLEAVRSNYLVRRLDVASSGGRLPIPARAVTAAVRAVLIQVGNAWFPIPQRALEWGDNPSSSGLPDAYYVDAASICFLPSGASATARVFYAERPGRMALDTDLSKCVGITGVSTVDPNYAFVVGGLYTGPAEGDLISSGAAHQNKCEPGVLNALTGEVAISRCFEAPVAGDYICAAGYTAFAPVPEELTGALIHRTAASMLRALGYDEEASAQAGLASDAIERSKAMLAPRNEGNPPRLVGGLRRALHARSRW